MREFKNTANCLEMKMCENKPIHSIENNRDGEDHETPKDSDLYQSEENAKLR